MKKHKQLRLKSIFAVLALAGTVLFSGCEDVAAAIPEEVKQQARVAIEDAVDKAVSEAVSQAVDAIEGVSEDESATPETLTKAAKPTSAPKKAETSVAPKETATPKKAEASAAPKETVSYKFRSRKLLSQHYDKHGKDMGFSDMKSYEKAASDVINNPNALNKIEKEDGDYVYYLETTNEFVILSTDGYIRTYYLPDSGKKYYDKQ